MTNTKEVNDQYFEKNETTGLYFDITGLPEDTSKPVAVTLDGKDTTYELWQIVGDSGEEIPNSYAVFASGYSEAGARTLTITDIILENGQKLTVQETQPISFEVLKDAPTITDLGYEIDGYSIKLKSKLNDSENSLVGTSSIEVIDELDDTVYTGPYDEEITIEDYNAANYFYVKVTSDYDRTANGADDPEHNKYYYKNQAILDEVLSLSKQYIELKNITDVKLYHALNDRTELVEEVSKSEINSSPNSYFLEISMRDLPTLNVKVKEALDIDFIL